jgi:hypothetical protein
LLLSTATVALTAGLPKLSAPVKTIGLQGETHHVQGIDVEPSRVWVTSVDVHAKKGLLFEYSLPGGALVRSVDITDGDRYHPGGISGDGESLWIPVAEYRRDGSSIVQKRNKRTLKIEFQFTVADHIGCIAVTPTELIGANWDARHLYVWAFDGTLQKKMANQAGNAIQDMKFVNGQLVAGGLLPDKSGAIDWIEYPGLKLVRRVLAGKTDRGVAYTHEGLAVANGRLWLLPEDGPSRLFAFDLDRQ